MEAFVKQDNALLNFLYDFDLMHAPKGFSAHIDYVLNGRRKIMKGQVSISFNEEEKSSSISIAGDKYAIMPGIFHSQSDLFEYIPEIVLHIHGESSDKTIGKYRVSIFPIIQN